MFFDRFDIHDWLYHYEVVVRRQGGEQVLARAPSRYAAERLVNLVPAGLEVSRQSLDVRRARGVHPDKVARLCLLIFLAALLLPGLWLPAMVQLLCLAVAGGLLSSGRQWRQGGRDDR